MIQLFNILINLALIILPQLIYVEGSIEKLDNQLFIDNHNSKQLSYTVKSNKFIERKFINGYYIDNNKICISKNRKKRNYWNNLTVVPDRFDWREHGAVSSVKNQGECGSCWAFSSTESIEGIWAIQKKQLYNLSEQELVDCSGYLGNQGCMGGLMDYGFEYVIENGLCLNSSYPYVSEQNDCNKSNCSSVVTINNYTDIESNTENLLQSAVYNQPISVAIQANTQSFQFYNSGVYSDPNCGFELDHGVLVVGYGYDEGVNMSYWIIKNSWGTDWGENGYIRILKDYNDTRGLCGIAMNASFPII